MRLVYDHRRGVCGMPYDQYVREHGIERRKAPMIIGDIEPYKSVVTGEEISGRRQHRDHLREHGLVEVGNEPLNPKTPEPLPDPVDDIKQAIEEVSQGRKPEPVATFDPEEFE